MAITSMFVKKLKLLTEILPLKKLNQNTGKGAAEWGEGGDGENKKFGG